MLFTSSFPSIKIFLQTTILCLTNTEFGDIVSVVMRQQQTRPPITAGSAHLSSCVGNYNVTHTLNLSQGKSKLS